jgi:PhoPQ-activated pathogenicity-related protein
MKNQVHRAWLFCLLVLLSLPLAAHAQSATTATALDRYIAQKDAVYGWKLVGTIPGQGCTGYVLELTSQTWRSEKDVDRPVWKHWLTIVKPDKLSSSKGLLYIGSGNNRNPAPRTISERARMIATATQSVVAEVAMVPNQPLYFTDSPDKARTEDDLIAYTRVKHFTTKDDFWLVRLAMVKSGVRALDAVQEFMASAAGGQHKLDEFVVTGASKRGWTAWLVGVVDPRVIAVAPMVIDALNSEAITRHHYEVLGFFAPSLKDYVNHGLFPHKLGTPEYQAVLGIEDPFNYRRRAKLKLPKFMLNAAGDEFFLPDNSRFYYGELPEEKHIRYVPNTKHNLAESDALQSLAAFYQAVITNHLRPHFTWRKEKDGRLVVTSKDKAQAVRLWQATNPAARDFRLDIIGKAYTSTLLTPEPNGSYVGRVSAPPKGFTAFFVELEYASGGPYPFKFTTEVSIVPDVVPYKWADAARQYEGTKK